MGKYLVELNGKKFQFEGNRPPTEEEAVAHISDMQGSSSDEARRVAMQGASGLLGDIPNIGNKPLSEILGGAVGQNMDLGSQIAQALPRLARSSVMSGPMAISNLQGNNPSPLINGSLNSRFGFPAPALPQTQGGQIAGMAANALGQAALFGGIENRPPLMKGAVNPDFAPPKPISKAMPFDGLNSEQILSEIGKEQQSIKNKMQAVDTNNKLLKQQEDFAHKTIENDARNTTLNYRNPKNYQEAFNRKYQSYGRGINFVTEGVDIPKQDIKSILLDAGQKNGLLDAEGNLTRQAKGSEKPFIEIARKYGALGSKQGGIPDEFVQAVKGGENLDPAMQKAILDAYKRDPRGVTTRGFGYDKGEYNKTVNLKNMLDEVSGVQNSSTKGAPTKYDRIMSNLHNSVIDYLDTNGHKVGFTPEKQSVLDTLKREYVPFAEFKNQFYDIIDPHNEAGSMNTDKGRKFFSALAKGEINSDQMDFANRFRHYVDPQFDFRLKSRGDALNAISRKKYILDLTSKSLNDWQKSIPESGELAEAFKKAKSTEDLLNNKVTPQKVVDYIKKFGMKYALRKAFVYTPFGMAQGIFKK